MPSEYIKGKDVMLYVLVGGVYRPVACYTNVVLNVENDMLETTSKDSGNWRYYKKGKSGWSATAEGVQYLDVPLRFDQMRQWGIEGRPLLIRFQSTGIKGTSFATWQGYCLVESDSTSGAVNEPAPFTLNLRGNGALEADFEELNEDEQLEMWHEYIADGTEGNVIMFDTPPHDLRGKIPSFRVFRGGTIFSPSGTLAEGNPATDAPVGPEYQWDILTGKMTFDPNYANLSQGERVYFPYVDAFSGCTLSIDGLSVSVNGVGKFYLQWNGTGIPAEQLLVEHSGDYGVSFQTASGTFSPAADSFTSTENFNTSASNIFRITPICVNGAKGTSDTAFWNTAIIGLTNNRLDTKMQFISYTRENGQPTLLGALNQDGSQKSVIVNNASPLSQAGATVGITLSIGKQGATGVVMDANGNTLGSAIASTSPYDSIQIYIPTGLPNEFKVILS